jgi:hypothetical protein
LWGWTLGRGPGIWQRLILDRIATGTQFYLVALLPDGYTTAQYSALHRAAYNLENAGIISIARYLCGIKKCLIGPPGAGIGPIGGMAPFIRPRRRSKGQQHPGGA